MKFLAQWKPIVLLAAVMVTYIVHKNVYSSPTRSALSEKQVRHHENITSPIGCYTSANPSLPDILDSPPTTNDSIFFVETSCRSHAAQRLVLTQRQACAVESAAKMNPNRNVYLLVVSPTLIRSQEDQNDRTIAALATYGNVHIKHVDFVRYTKGTPLEQVYKKLLLSNWPVQHASDILRFLTLWRFGGIYMDLDVVVTSSFDRINPNFAGKESDRDLAAGVIGFTRKDWAESCVMDLKENYLPKNWGNNGPGVIQRFVDRVCEANGCGNFTVFPPKVFYPIHWKEWWKYFEVKHRKEVMTLTDESKAIHLWNMFSSKLSISTRSRSAFALIAKEHCPKAFGLTRNLF